MREFLTAGEGGDIVLRDTPEKKPSRKKEVRDVSADSETRELISRVVVKWNAKVDTWAFRSMTMRHIRSTEAP